MYQYVILTKMFKEMEGQLLLAIHLYHIKKQFKGGTNPQLPASLAASYQQ